MADRESIDALKNMLAQVETLLTTTTPLPENRTPRWLTYAYSKKWEHLHAALALHFAYYDFCRVHRSLRVTRQWRQVSRVMCGNCANF